MKNRVTELTVTMQLALEQMDDANLGGLAKRHGNMFKDTIEKLVVHNYSKLYALDPQMVTNIMQRREFLIRTIASLDENELIFLTDVVGKFIENKDEYLKDRETMLNEIL